MITLEDLNKKKIQCDGITESNLLALFQRLKKLESLYQGEMIITSGLRSAEQQENLIKAGKSNAVKSKHLFGAAADIFDPDGKLRDWLLANPEALVQCSLWCEHWSKTVGWTHLQIFPPASGSRWFYP